MALQMDIETNIGTYEGAYIKITKIVGTKTGVTIYVKAYTDNTCETPIKDIKRESDEEMTGDLFGYVPVDTNNWLKQGYNYLKTLDQFSAAIDC